MLTQRGWQHLSWEGRLNTSHLGYWDHILPAPVLQDALLRLPVTNITKNEEDTDYWEDPNSLKNFSYSLKNIFFTWLTEIKYSKHRINLKLTSLSKPQAKYFLFWLGHNWVWTRNPKPLDSLYLHGAYAFRRQGRGREFQAGKWEMAQASPTASPSFSGPVYKGGARMAMTWQAPESPSPPWFSVISETLQGGDQRTKLGRSKQRMCIPGKPCRG